VLLPLAIVGVAIAVAVAVVATGAGKRAADRELDARAATVKKAWEVAGQPARPAALDALSRRLDARLDVVRGGTPAEGHTVGAERTYAFASRGKRVLTVALATNGSADALSSGLVAALIAGLAGVMLLVALGSALLRSAAAGPLRAVTAAIYKVHAGDHTVRAPVAGSREVRKAADAFNRVAARSAELDQAVGTDTVTGLLSSERVVHALEIELKRAARDMAQLALVVIDMDNFRALNEAHGKQAGDQLLRAVADRLQPCLRATDVVGRVTGDEFALILPQAVGDQVEMIVSRAREALADVVVEGFSISFCAGYALYPSDAREAQTLMQAAEGALRSARRAGPGATARFDPAEGSVKGTEGERHDVIALLDAPDGILPVFQPLVALATGQVSGYEALSRFKQPPNRRPDEWFLLAQRVGLGPALEARAIQAALAVAGRPAGTYLSLNLSPSTLTTPEVQAVLPEDLSGIVIEVTEHELAANDSILGADLVALRARGARVAVDDAGAGYAGLQQLMRVAPDLIKLDRSLVQNIDTDPAKQALVDSFVRFGRRTGAQVVAEGIETEDELRTLADLDVDYGQGYFLAKPGPAWPAISPWVSEKLLRRSLGATLSAEDITHLPVGSDQRLAAVCSAIAQVRNMAELDALSSVIAEEIGADDYIVLVRDYDGGLAATSSRPWLPSGGRFDVVHFPAFEGVMRRGEPEQFLLERGSGTTTSLGEIALLANSGHRSMLAVPIGSQALLQAFCEAERPWGRAATNRALVIGYQLAPVLTALTAHAPAA
jgi:diguanylate cyclase (GGDEF)-like protein